MAGNDHLLNFVDAYLDVQPACSIDEKETYGQCEITPQKTQKNNPSYLLHLRRQEITRKCPGDPEPLPPRAAYAPY